MVFCKETEVCFVVGFLFCLSATSYCEQLLLFSYCFCFFWRGHFARVSG